MTETPTTALTDCRYFLNNQCDKQKCRFRHCPEALTTHTPCPLWPKCRNLKCPHLHPSMMSTTPNSTPTATNRPVLAAPSVHHRNTVSVLWDIENMAIPRKQKAFDIVMRLRQRLIEEKKLTEDSFTAYCNCDILTSEHKIGLNKANVCIKNISSVKAGGVDQQILMDLHKFKEEHEIPATVVLISGDIDFIKYLNELRFRHQHTVIIIHNRQAPSELVQTGNQAYLWDEFTTVPADTLLPDSNHHVKTQDIYRSNSPIKMNLSRPPTNLNSVDKFKCPQCPAIMMNEKSLENHQLHYKHWYDCNYPKCYISCLTPESLQRHVKRDHIDAAAANCATFACGICTKLFSTDARRAQHQQDKHDLVNPLESSSTVSEDDLQIDDKQSFDETHFNVSLIDFDDNNYSQPERSGSPSVKSEIGSCDNGSDCQQYDDILESRADFPDALLTDKVHCDSEPPTNLQGNENKPQVNKISYEQTLIDELL